MTTADTRLPLTRRWIGVLALVLGASIVEASAQGVHSPGAAPHVAAAGGGASSGFLDAVRAATERFRDVAVAEAEGYTLMFGCVSGPDWGAMGLHYVNLALVGDGVLDPARPESSSTSRCRTGGFA